LRDADKNGGLWSAVLHSARQSLKVNVTIVAVELSCAHATALEIRE
jgi:hypothetical protein